MTIYPPELTAHLRRDVTSVCYCWRLERKDGVVFGFTDHDQPLTVDGTLCHPETGLAASEAKQSLGFAVDTMDIEGAFSSAEIEADDVSAGKFDGAAVETFLVNWRQPGQFARLRKLAIAKVTSQDGRFIAELESATSALDRPNGRHIARACDAELGDRRCGVALTGPDFGGAGAVARALSADTVAVTGLATFVTGWFAHGKLSWTSGVNMGLEDVVVADRSVGSERLLTLRREVGSPAAEGDDFTIVAGCDKAFATCKAKFGNQRNFRGFPHLPGNDAAYNYVVDGGSHDGKPIVP